MVTATRNRPKSVSVSQRAIDQVGSFLQDLSEKPREEMSLREAIDQLREPIQGALAKGYTYEDIVGILGEQGIKTTATTIKRYISIGNSQKRKAKAAAEKTTGKRKTRAVSDTDGAAESFEEETPAPTKGRRKPAAASAKSGAKTKATVEPKPASKGRTSAKAASATKTTGRGRKKA